MNIDKTPMIDRFQTVETLRLSSSLSLLGELIQEWSSKNPEHPKLKKASSCYVEIGLLTNKMEIDRQSYVYSIEEYRTRSIRSEERARRAEKRIIELEEQLKKYKTKENLGL